MYVYMSQTCLCPLLVTIPLIRVLEAKTTHIHPISTMGCLAGGAKESQSPYIAAGAQTAIESTSTGPAVGNLET